MSYPFIRFVPTSTLDQIEPCEPFVHAVEWASFRRSFVASKSSGTGNRNCIQAIQSLNDPSDWVFVDGPQAMEQDTFSIVLKSVPEGFCEQEVDRCFTDNSLSFLDCTPASTSRSSQTEALELELQLLESVNELAANLARTRVRRASPSAVVSNQS